MTNTPMSERERELLLAAKDFVVADEAPIIQVPDTRPQFSRLKSAIAAYDPKPEKEYTMPEWEEFSKWRSGGWRSDIGQTKISERFVILDEGEITEKIYNAIREATSRTKAPTE